jgi:hypothetical protein
MHPISATEVRGRRRPRRRPSRRLIMSALPPLEATPPRRRPRRRPPPASPRRRPRTYHGRISPARSRHQRISRARPCPPRSHRCPKTSRRPSSIRPPSFAPAPASAAAPTTRPATARASPTPRASGAASSGVCSATGGSCGPASCRTRAGSSTPASTSPRAASTATCTPPRRNKAALIWEGEPGDHRVLTYFELHREVCRTAAALLRLGIKTGDRVIVYMPMVPELVIAVLACARIGATHSVIFGGFSAEAIRDRINDAGAIAVITADGGYRRGKVVPLKHNVVEALQHCPGVRHVVVVQSHRPRHHHAPRARPLLCRARQGRVRSLRACHGRRRAPAVHPLHLGHHRQAQGRGSRPAATAPRSPSPPSTSSISRRGHLLLHRRCRLGHRSQLHRLRPAYPRRHRS